MSEEINKNDAGGGAREDNRQFSDSAYRVVLMAIGYAQERAKGHVKGGALLEDMVRMVVGEYGIMGGKVLVRAGLTTPRLVGRCVFEMVGLGIMSATEEDRIEDFDVEMDLLEAVRHEWPNRDKLIENVRSM